MKEPQTGALLAYSEPNAHLEFVMSTSVSFRQVVQEDFERLAVLYAACFAEPPWYEVFDSAAVRAEFEEMLTWAEIQFWVAVDASGCVIGAGIGFNVCRKNDVSERLPPALRNSFYIAELFVDPASRTRGVCRGLTSAIVFAAQQNGFTSASVRTSIDQQVIRHLFVETLGYEVVGTEEVTSEKCIDGNNVQVPDTRVLMGKVQF